MESASRITTKKSQEEYVKVFCTSLSHYIFLASCLGSHFYCFFYENSLSDLHELSRIDEKVAPASPKYRIFLTAKVWMVMKSSGRRC
jgi:hypothetical protein